MGDSISGITKKMRAIADLVQRNQANQPGADTVARCRKIERANHAAELRMLADEIDAAVTAGRIFDDADELVDCLRGWRLTPDQIGTARAALDAVEQVLKEEGRAKAHAPRMTRMTQKTYTQAEFGEFIEKSCGKELESFRTYYPSDPRCMPRLWLEWKTKDGSWEVCYAEDVDDVAAKLGDPAIVSLEWHLCPNEYVTIIRKEQSNESLD